MKPNLKNFWSEHPKPPLVEYALLQHAGRLGIGECESILALYLHDRQGENPCTFVGQNLICSELGVGVKQLRTSVHRLENIGLLSVTQNFDGQTHNRYDIRTGLKSLGFGSPSKGYLRDFLRYGCRWFGIDIHAAALWTYLRVKQGKERSCWPSNSQISADLGMGGRHRDYHYKQLRKSLQSLIDAKALSSTEVQLQDGSSSTQYDVSPGLSKIKEFRVQQKWLGIVNDPATTSDQLEECLENGDVSVHYILWGHPKATEEQKKRAVDCFPKFASFCRDITDSQLEVLQSIH